ncbi:MAG: Nif3-like dinuclear metal center hexameric protein [Leptospirales bacterium]|jgi:dinuclear metal center YbgI/SA1388 family protein
MTTRSPLTCGDVARWLETLAPPHLAEDYDNVGLLVGEPDQVVSGILIALDITPEVLAEAVRNGANLVISHHPIWFRSRKTLRGDDFVSRQILYAIRNGLALYACHTNLDSVRDGVNRTIVDRLGLSNVEFLRPRPGGARETDSAHSSSGRDGNFCEAGTGMIGELPTPLKTEELLGKVRSVFGCGCVRYTPGPADRDLRIIAVCGGAGSFLLETARARGADAFLTADVTYHQFFETCGEMLFMDIGHYESEQFTSEVIRDYLRKEIGGSGQPELSIRVTEHNTNPVRYFTGES